VHIEQFDPGTDDRRLRACHEMMVAGQPEDDPNVPPMLFRQFRGWWAFGFSDSPVQAWLATCDSGEPIGASWLELPERENRRNAFAHVIVAPHRRRRGAGRALLANLAASAALADRTLLMGETRIGSAGTPFAQATGGRTGMRDVRRTQEFDQGLRARLPDLRASAEPHAVGYTLRSWCGLTPEEYVGGVCALFTALGDAPHDDAFEPAAWDPARLRRAEQRLLAQGTRCHSVAAVTTAAGEVAAITQVNVEPGRPEWGWQEITAVTKPHRGHRLGLLVKVAMLELVAEREPGLRHIATFNAE
jgi:GNAT superfamily N-acetyltransferase